MKDNLHSWSAGVCWSMYQILSKYKKSRKITKKIKLRKKAYQQIIKHTIREEINNKLIAHNDMKLAVKRLN